MKLIPLLLLSACGGAWAAAALPTAESLQWRAVTFGQSTDKNFATNVLPEKVASIRSLSPTGRPTRRRAGCGCLPSLRAAAAKSATAMTA
ncbi:hypothetical protein HA44_16990 [Mixta gaviniae]|nr:hypothetical protein HA44_16990 [Mixta gaviniae]